jgi:putative ATP-binding cassette transporter
MDRFDRQFFRRLWSLTKPYWYSDQRRTALGLFVLLLLFMFGAIGLQGIFSFILRDLTNALVAKDATRYYRLLEYVLVWVLVMVPVAAYAPWIGGRLAILWREWLTHRFTELGFSNHGFYRIGLSGRADNPDQRISEDINTFTGQTLDYLFQFLASAVTFATFFGILWSISPRLALVLSGAAVAGTYASALVGGRLVTINFNQQRYEADFRFALVHVRDHAEEITMYGGEHNESARLNRRFGDVFRNFNLLILWQRRPAFVTFFYTNALVLLANFLLAGAYFAGKLQLGQFTQAAMAYSSLTDALSLVVTKFQGLTSYAAVVNRLAMFREECESLEAELPNGRSRIQVAEAADLEFDRVTLLTPDYNRALLSGLSFKLACGDRLLVKGPSGVGKTSLLRAIAQIWQAGEGRILRPPAGDNLFLSQRPYMILGTLMNQLCYPRAAGASEDEMRQALYEVNLGDLLDRVPGFDTELNWAHVLSPGEQQRLAFARLFLHRPRYVFLDEATSALDSNNEAILYRHLEETGTTVLSVSHHAGLLRYHKRVLELAGGANWKLVPCTAAASANTEPNP